MPADVAVMVTGVGGGGHGEQIIKALRLSTRRYTIIGADSSPVSKGLMEVDDAYVLPPAADPDYVPCFLAGGRGGYRFSSSSPQAFRGRGWVDARVARSDPRRADRVR